MAQQRHGNVSPDVDDAGQKVRGFDPGLCCYFFRGKALVVLALVDGREQMCFGWPEKRTLFYDIAWLETVQTVNLHNRKLIDCAEARDFKRARNESPFLDIREPGPRKRELAVAAFRHQFQAEPPDLA